MDVSIVIASFNTAAVTRQCLAAIFGHTRRVTFEVIVVDNGSSDGSADLIAEEFPSARLIRLPKNVGFAAAQNIGMRHAAGDSLLILNSDALVIGDAVAVLKDRLWNGPQDVAMVGPQVLNPDGSVAPSARRTTISRVMLIASIVNRHFDLRRWLPEKAMRRYLSWLLAPWHDNYDRHDRMREVQYVDGMCVLVRRDTLCRVGLFDEQFFFDAEILDLANRVRSAGGRIIFDPAAQVVHLGHVSRRKVSRIVIESYRSLLTYLAKYAPDRVPLAKTAIAWTIRAKRAIIVARGRIGHSDPDATATLSIYDDILNLVRTFDPGVVWTRQRIPPITDSGRSHTGVSECV